MELLATRGSKYHMRFCRGDEKMRPGGYVDTTSLFHMVDTFRLLEQAQALSEKEVDRLKDWSSKMLSWLEENEPIAISIKSPRSHATEYHGTAWDVQVSVKYSF